MSWQQPPFQQQPGQPPFQQQPGGAPYPGGQPGVAPQAYPGQGMPYPVQPGPYPNYPGQVYPPQGQAPMPMAMGYPAQQPQPMQYPPQGAGAMAGVQPGLGQGTIRVQFGASKLMNKDFVGKSDPFYTISRMDGKGNAVGLPIHKSEVVSNNLSPVWQPLTTSVDKFCGGDYHETLKMEIWDYDIAGSKESMGFVTFTLREIMDARNSGRKFHVAGAKKMGITRSKAGEVYVQDFSLWQEHLPK